MPEFFINGKPVVAKDGQTVMEAAQENGVYIPYFCWHPNLSVAGNCRICTVEVEDGKGGGWMDIACNMPVTEGMRVLTDSEPVKARRKATLELVTLNHPVDCGICDKAGECQLQDYHYAYNGERSKSCDAKVTATKFYPLSSRITLDNERCILCTRCVRFTREVSRSNALGIQNRGDHSLIRPAFDGALEDDPYSDNVVDLCPVGALLSTSFRYKARVWYLEPTPSVCPGCARGCNVQLWHRKADWKVHSLDPHANVRIERVTPRANPAVNGPWTCNKARDLPRLLERPRAEHAMLKGRPIDLARALDEAARLISMASRRVALVSSWGSDEELATFKTALGDRFACRVKADEVAERGEVVEDDVLIRADKNPNTTRAKALFGDAPPVVPADADLVFVWGAGADIGALPHGAAIVLMSPWLAPENGHADVFIPLSLWTERDGHFTNFQGTVSAFRRCQPRRAGVADAESAFAALAERIGVTA